MPPEIRLSENSRVEIPLSGHGKGVLASPASGFHRLVALCDCLDYQSCELSDYSNPLLDAITAQFKANCRHSIKSPVWSI